jgi:16S rRNA A1518/A1519 N6-dimethyltransferase RsmA/KsgA/DIM1 with predicted DNA glycosylase/AP lyase activity
MALILFFLIVLFLLGGIIFYSIKTGITPTPSTTKAMKVIVDAIPLNVQGTIFELGSGWGNLVFLLAKRFPLCTIKAYELSPIPWFVSCLIQSFLNYRNLHIYRKDFFNVPLQDACVIICYLYPGAMKSLKGKFEKELREGTIVISHTFAISGWVPVKVLYLKDIYQTPIYYYQFGP